MASRIKTVKFVRELAEGEKVAPQVKAMVESVVEAHGLNTEVTVEQIAKAMEGNVTTRQPLERIFGYYAPKLEEAGLITVERAVTEPKPKKEKAEKTAKAAKAGEDVSGELSGDVDDEEGDE